MMKVHINDVTICEIDVRRLIPFCRIQDKQSSVANMNLRHKFYEICESVRHCSCVQCKDLVALFLMANRLE